jgi:hypothetical protein
MMIERYRGDTFSMVWNLKINGAVADLTGASVKFAYQKTDSVVLVINGSLTDAPNGEVTFPVLVSDFDTSGTYDYDLQVTFADSTIRTFVQDVISIKDDINKT